MPMLPPPSTIPECPEIHEDFEDVKMTYDDANDDRLSDVPEYVSSDDEDKEVEISSQHEKSP